MKHLAIGTALLAACTASLAVDFAQVQPALDKDGCTGCHAVNGNVSGPSFHDIAARYVKRPDVRSYLAGKIRDGSSNTWGAAAMPPSPQVDDLEMKAIVEWIATGAAAPAPAPRP